MLGLSLLDWMLVLIVVLSVLQAAAQGFFYEFVRVGRRGCRISGGCMGVSTSRQLGMRTTSTPSGWRTSLGSLTIFLLVVLLASVAGTDCPMGGQRRRAALV